MLTEILGTLQETQFGFLLVFFSIMLGCVVLGIYLFIDNLYVHEESRKKFFFWNIIMCLLAVTGYILYFVVWMKHYRPDLLDFLGMVVAVVTLAGTLLIAIVKRFPESDKPEEKYPFTEALTTFVMTVLFILSTGHFVWSHYRSNYAPSIVSHLVKNLSHSDKIQKFSKKHLRTYSFDAYTKSGDDANGLGMMYQTHSGFQQQAFDAFQIACSKFGHVNGCFNLGIMYLKYKKDKSKALEMMQQLCDSNFADGCMYAFHYHETKSDSIELALAKRYLGKACYELKSSSSCFLYGVSLRETKRFREALVAQFMTLKFNPGELKSVATYILIKDVERFAGNLTKKEKLSLPRLPVGCSHPDENRLYENKVACHLKATILRDGWYGKPNFAQAYAYYRKACLLGNGNSCLEIYCMVKAKQTSKITLKQAERLRNYACKSDSVIHANIIRFCKSQTKLALRTKH